LCYGSSSVGRAVEQIFAAPDAIAERVRKVGGTTLRSIGHIGRPQRFLDNNAEYVTSLDMLAELCDCFENWIDEASGAGPRCVAGFLTRRMPRGGIRGTERPPLRHSDWIERRLDRTG
jgi:hypothetical protein